STLIDITTLSLHDALPIFIKDLQHPEIVFNMDSQWFGETKAGTRQYNEALKSEGVKIMMKPQVWVWKGEFTGFIEMESEENWSRSEEHTSELQSRENLVCR